MAAVAVRETAMVRAVKVVAEVVQPERALEQAQALELELVPVPVLESALVAQPLVVSRHIKQPKH
ncbi:hypothetical protein [Endozoicomonas sp. SCSIO W0465]|uniref:hypothetical protein n=1 Tax=Endozoicomonas sp. SCSIO W0465 TaxID=2918516 RepID=UPI002075F8CB|nr:hypothetical protein [Endozoicomonas sp. SCSIO W0465]USE35359.1 hypothetical protein MJO57_25175 [Endozoicomonas sp. SCSIO W0465]